MEELGSVHTASHIAEVQSYSSTEKSDLCRLEETWKTYSCDNTFTSAASAAGCVLAMTEAICQNQVSTNLGRWFLFHNDDFDRLWTLDVNGE